MEIVCEDGKLLIEDLGDGRRRLTAVRAVAGGYRARDTCVTTYPLELIQKFLHRTGVVGVCEVIGRDGDSQTEAIRRLTMAYCDLEELNGKRILDFGCGGGASTVVLAKLFPLTRVVGVELLEEKLKLGRARADHYGLTNVQFLASPHGSELPANLGTFDLIYMFAVYEHLLPEERRVVMSLLWNHLNPGGILFIDATPHRYFPIDLHSTHLPLINYLPDRLAHFVARHFARGGEVNKSPVWTDHLRGGLRGATEGEILRNLKAQGGMEPTLLDPSNAGLRDRSDYWYSCLNPKRHAPAKKAARLLLKAIYKVTGTVLTPNLSLAIRKPVCP